MNKIELSIRHIPTLTVEAIADLLLNEYGICADVGLNNGVPSLLTIIEKIRKDFDFQMLHSAGTGMII